MGFGTATGRGPIRRVRAAERRKTQCMVVAPLSTTRRGFTLSYKTDGAQRIQTAPPPLVSRPSDPYKPLIISLQVPPPSLPRRTDDLKRTHGALPADMRGASSHLHMHTAHPPPLGSSRRRLLACGAHTRAAASSKPPVESRTLPVLAAAAHVGGAHIERHASFHAPSPAHPSTYCALSQAALDSSPPHTPSLLHPAARLLPRTRLCSHRLCSSVTTQQIRHTCSSVAPAHAALPLSSGSRRRLGDA